MLQAPMLNGLSFDASPFGKDTGSPAEVNIGRGQVVETLMVAMMVVVVDEGLDLRSRSPGR